MPMVEAPVPGAGLAENVTLEISAAGFQTRTETLSLTEGQRTKADYTLTRE